MEDNARILMAVAAFFVLVLAFFGGLIWGTRKAVPGRVQWSTANLLYALCLLLLTVRSSVPAWIGVVGANTFVVGATILALEGTRAFRGLRPRIWAAYLGGGLAILAVVYFTYISNNLNARASVLSLFMGSVAALCSITLLKGMPSGNRLGMVYTGAMFALSAAVQIARAIYFHFASPMTDSGMFATPWANAANLGTALSIASCSIGWRVLSNERLLDSMAGRVAAADAGKSQFVKLMSHEIRNPLSGIKAVADLLLDTSLTQEQQEMMLERAARSKTRSG